MLGRDYVYMNAEYIKSLVSDEIMIEAGLLLLKMKYGRFSVYVAHN